GKDVWMRSAISFTTSRSAWAIGCQSGIVIIKLEMRLCYTGLSCCIQQRLVLVDFAQFAERRRRRELAARPKGLVALLDRADERLLADGLKVVVRVALV